MGKETKYDPRSEKLGMKVELEVEGKKVTYPSKSQAIIALHRNGVATGDIAKALGIRYQFAYNVIKRLGK